MMTQSSSEPLMLSGPVSYRGINTATDMDRIRALHSVCFPVVYDDRFFNWMHTPQCVALVASVPNDKTLNSGSGVGSGDMVIGFIIGKIKFVEGPILTKPVMYISTFGVDPAYRAHGVGHELLERFVDFVCDPGFLQTEHCAGLTQSRDGSCGWLTCCIQKLAPAKPFDQIWLHCLADDGAVVRFYTKRRFVQVDRLSAYYEFNNAVHDAFIMCREEVKETPTQAAAKKGNPLRGGTLKPGGGRSITSQSLWEMIAGTTISDALAAQDDFDKTESCLPGRSFSKASWFVVLSGVLCILVIVLLWNTVSSPSSGGRGGAVRRNQ